MLIVFDQSDSNIVATKKLRNPLFACFTFMRSNHLAAILLIYGV